MPDPQRLIEEMEEHLRTLSMKNDELQELATRRAESERNYRIALQQKILELRLDGQPATIINDLARGNKTVAQFKFERDVSRGLSDACRSAIRGLEIGIDAKRSLLSWLKTEKSNSG